MRTVTVTLTPPAGSHIAYELFETNSDLEREEIYHLNVLADGSVVLLGRVRGDIAEARRLLEDRPEVLGYSLSRGEDYGGLLYVHARPPPEIKRFLTLPQTHEVFFEFPLESTADGRLRVVMIGETNEVLQEALAEMPPELDVTVERIGPYPDASENIASLLTDRQREVLDVALDLGYYDVPRQASHRDIAEQLDLSVGTVGEHLQKIESRVFTNLL
jgi:DNA-binding CsgD family transcriptional regulator